MVSHESEFLAHAANIESGQRYVRFLHDIAETAKTAISPRTLRSDADIERFAAKLTSKYSEKSVKNYRSVMRKYVAMVEELGLSY